jgi:hypothetical protein
MTNKRMQAAFKELNSRIEAGEEFPDIISRLARKHKVSETQLTAIYDAQ